VGDAATGKTNIAYTFVREKPPANIMPTVAVEFSSKSLHLDNGRKIRVQTWDTAGQETYRAITMKYLLLYSVTIARPMAPS
jgi:Ras-related protein Rab-2A